jgi:hypothetical protein
LTLPAGGRLAPPVANERIPIYHDDAHRVTRPVVTRYKISIALAADLPTIVWTIGAFAALKFAGILTDAFEPI